MRLLIQRVNRARVTVDGEETGAIGLGLLVYVGVGRDDGDRELDWAARRIAELRLFPGERGLDRSLDDVEGSVLVVSQFTLYGNVNKGTRPSFDKSAPADQAQALYDRFVGILDGVSPNVVKTGVFQAHMEVALVNDGPVTITIDKETP